MQESQAESRAMAEEQKEEQVLLNLAKVWAKPITDDATAEAHADALKMLTEKITRFEVPCAMSPGPSDLCFRAEKRLNVIGIATRTCSKPPSVAWD